MHDTTWFEINGKPAVFIASDEFQEAATAQAETLGLPSVQRVFVPHPKNVKSPSKQLRLTGLRFEKFTCENQLQNYFSNNIEYYNDYKSLNF